MKIEAIFFTLNILMFVNGDITVNSTTHVDDTEKFLTNVSSSNYITSRQSKYGFIRFEDDYDSKVPEDTPNNNIKFEEDHKKGPPFKFQDDLTEPNTQVTNQLGYGFQDDNRIEEQNTQLNDQIGYGFNDDNKIEEPKPQKKKKRRRRRRKPRYQNFQQGYPNPNFIPQGQYAFPGYQYPGGPLPQGTQAQNELGPYPYPFTGGPAGQFYKPPRRQKQSIASEALSAITGALTSIALYDDYQCVPRLLCEAAGGGALGSSSLLQNVAGLQPLLTLLAAYNGISSSPLFIFGRAVFLGMTSKGNLGSCRYAYPQCPTDPEQLVHYLNNHNGGFFRFFNAPQNINHQYGQQNLEQFYNQLSIPQNYGLSQPNAGNLQGQQNYGFYQPNADLQNQQNYGSYPNIPGSFQGYYGFQSPHNNLAVQNYGPNYPYQNNYGFKRIRFKNINDQTAETNKIEKRIQNKPIAVYIEENLKKYNSKWLFPDTKQNNNDNTRGERGLKFPEEYNNGQFIVDNDFTRKGKGLIFPDNTKNNANYINYNNYNSLPTSFIFNNNFELTNQNKMYDVNVSNHGNNYDGLETVYVVRGNGDPNHPEIIKVKPGETIQ